MTNKFSITPPPPPPPIDLRKPLFILTLALIFVFSFAACKNDSTDPTPDPREAYYGTWGRTSGDTYTEAIISANSFKYNVTTNGSPTGSYTITGLSWTPQNGTVDGYPTGYIMQGTVHDTSTMYPTKPEGGTARPGDTAAIYWFIHTGGNSLIQGSRTQTGGIASQVFTKQ